MADVIIADKEQFLLDMEDYNYTTCIGGYKLSRVKDDTKTEYYVPEGVKIIGAYAFDDCHCMTEIVIPRGVERIEEGAFNFCTSLTAVTLPNTLTEIEKGAFADCHELERVIYVGDKPQWSEVKVGPDNTYLLKSEMIYPNQALMKDDSDERADYCQALSDFKYITDNEGVTLIGVNNKDITVATVPDIVVKIKFPTFWNCKRLKALIFTKGVKEIEYTAFKGCSSLTHIFFVGRREEFIPCRVDRGWFNGHTVVFLNEYPSEVELQKHLNGRYIYDKKGYPIEEIPITDLVIPEGVEAIGYREYAENKDIVTVTIPDGVTAIRAEAFVDCPKLESVIIPGSVKFIGNEAFKNCKKLKSVTIGEGVTSIGESAFEYCESLRSITLPDTVSSMSRYAFRQCKLLSEFVIPKGVTVIGESTFLHCDSLSSVTIHDGVKRIENGAFCYCKWLSRFTLPDGLEYIGRSAFSESKYLSSVTIPDGISKIEGWCFWGCSGLESITIPDSVTAVDEMAFKDCEKLAHIYYRGNKKQWKAIEIDNKDKGNKPFLKAKKHFEWKD